jgi:hypothetical protein
VAHSNSIHTIQKRLFSEGYEGMLLVERGRESLEETLDLRFYISIIIICSSPDQRVHHSKTIFFKVAVNPILDQIMRGMEITR